jgi:hypothetical protein
MRGVLLALLSLGMAAGRPRFYDAPGEPASVKPQRVVPEDAPPVTELPGTPPRFHRLALVTLWGGPLPRWLPFLCHSAKRSALIADILIVMREDDEHVAPNRLAMSEWCGENVQLTVSARGRLVELFGSVLARERGWDTKRTREAKSLIRSAQSRWPRL